MAVEQQGSYVSAFMSYTWADADLVYEVADELGRWGVLPWLDKTHMRAGDPLLETLQRAIAAQAFFVPILSPSTASSTWVTIEIEEALATAPERILPVCVGISKDDAYLKHGPLKHWASKNTERVAVLERSPEAIAKEIAKAAFQKRRIASAPEVALYFDQRGRDLRAGPPLDLPGAIMNAQPPVPTLVFRHDRGPRHGRETLTEMPWHDYQADIVNSLSSALPNRPGRTIHVCGNAQLSIAWCVGSHFEGDEATIKGYPVRELYGGAAKPIENTNWPPRRRMANVVADPEKPVGDGHPYLKKRLPEGATVAALLAGPQNYIRDALGYTSSRLKDTALLWYQTEDVLSSKEGEQVITDLVQLLQRLKDLGVLELHFLNCLPFHVTPLAAKYLSAKLGSIRYHEYRRDLEGRGFPASEMYTLLGFGDADPAE